MLDVLKAVVTVLDTHGEEIRKYVGPVPTYYAAVRLELHDHKPNPDLCTEDWHTGEHLHQFSVFAFHTLFLS